MPDQSVVRRKPLLLGLALLLLGQAWISAVHWLQLPRNTSDGLSSISCSILPICNLRYPPYFGLVLLILLVAMVLLGLSLRRVALSMTGGDIDLSVPHTYSGRWRRLFLLLATLAVLVTAFTAYNAISTANRYPHPLLWFGTILLWGIAFYSLDRATGRPSIITFASILGVLGYILLLLLLGFLYHTPVLQSSESRIAFVIGVTLALYGLWRVKRISGLVAIWILIAVVGLAIYTYQLDSWRYAFVGDEYAFYNAAQIFLRNPNISNLLSSRGVYSSHPVFATFVQSLTLLLYGENIYGWRFNSVLMVFLSAPAIFVLVCQLAGRNVGLLAAIFFVSAHHLMGLSHVGYNQPQLLPSFTMMLMFLAIALHYQSRLAMFLAGVCAAFSFYTFTLGVPLIPLPLLVLAAFFLISTSRLPLKRRVMAVMPLVIACMIGILVTALPRVSNTTWFSDGVSNTIFAHSEMKDVSDPLLQQLVPNVLYTLSASLYFDQKSHYISGALLDPISSILMLLGVTGLITVATKRYTALLLLLSFLTSVFVVGGSVPYIYPSHTRTFLLVTFYAIFAALGTAYLWETGHNLFPPRAAFIVLVTAVLVLNTYQFFYIYEHTNQSNRMSMMVREFQFSSPETTFYYVDRVPDDQNLLMVLDSFEFDTERLIPVTNASPIDALREIRRDAVAPYRVLIGRETPDWLVWLDAAQTVWVDYLMQEVKDESGVVHFIAIDVPD